VNIKRRLRFFFIITAFLIANHLIDWGPFDVAVTFAQSGQALTTTTTVALIGAGQQCFTLASVAGISGFGPGINNPVAGTSAGTGNITNLYIDRELMQVVSVNATAKVVCVLHGMSGSQAAPHGAGSTVIIGPPGAFFNYDPEGYCGGPVGGVSFGGGPSNPPQFTPWINTRTAVEWICSTVTKTWAPGFNNPLVPVGAITTTSLALVAGTNTPTGPLFHTTTTNAVVTWTAPVGCNATAATASSGCSFTIIPDAICTWTAAGNIAIAGSCVVNKALTFTWDAQNQKWVPSYIA
jgi:hypothetical protein